LGAPDRIVTKTFVLPSGDIDKLREVGGRPLRQSAEYELLVLREFGGAPAK
jgi:hypothetical protein